MRDVEAQLIHDMQNSALVLREAAAQLHENRTTLPPGVIARLTEMMARRSGMLVKLLNDLATSNLSERGEPNLALQQVALSDICDALLTEHQSTTESQITVDVAYDAVAVADPVRLTQVLDNLVANALRYGGPNVHVSAARAGAHVQLCVGDDGPGVPRQLVDTLFDAYVRGADSQRHGGSGLGLASVRHLCEVMHGTVAYDDSHGSRFIATLPAVPVPSRSLGIDVASVGHSAVLWDEPESFAESVVGYVAHGLAAGEAVLVAATPDHHDLLAGRLEGMGIDVLAATATGQYLCLDAVALGADLQVAGHIGSGRFESLVGARVQLAARRWRRLRVYGEIVDVFWHAGDTQLAMELEACWNALRARAPFPLLCGYERMAGVSTGAICDCHDLVLSA
jgi:hypothetical protein